MHELSIVMNILDTVEESARDRQASIVKEVELEIGLLSGVEFDALDFALKNAPERPLFKNTFFKVLKINPAAQCLDCSHSFETITYATACPLCQSIKTKLIKGNELRIKSFSYD